MSRSARIAIIDDDESVGRSLGRLLQLQGFLPTAYLSAEGFLDDTTRSDFVCLLVDIQLGGMSGIDLGRQLVAEGSDIPVIFITAHDDPATRSVALKMRCAGYFRKTDPGTDIVAAINRATSGAP